MKLLLAVLLVAAPLVSSDRETDTDWQPSTPFNPLTWPTLVTWQSCGPNTQLPPGAVCHIYEPCTINQGVIDDCIAPYYRQVTADFKFNCYLPTKPINAACTKKGECYSLSSCDINGSNTCKCPPGTKASSDNMVCENDYSTMVTVGSTCTMSFQCGNSAQCGADRTIAGNNSTCSCYPGYKPAANNIDCVSMMPGDPCTTNSSLPSNSACLSGTFQCLTGYKYVNTLQTGDMFGDLIFGSQPGPACVVNSATLNVGLNGACSSTNVCSPMLYCESCDGSSTVCQGKAVLSATPLSTSTTTAHPQTCAATSLAYTSLVVIGVTLLAVLLL